MRRIAALLTVPLLLVSAAACGSDDDSSSPTTKGGIPAVSGKADEEPKVAKGEGDPPKTLKVKVLKEGTGKEVTKGSAVTANYLGQSWDGKVFDNSWAKNQPATFEIGLGRVVKGWDEGLVGQKVGSRVELVIPPDKAYGANPPANSGIEKNATLVFVVDIKSMINAVPKGQKVPQDDPKLPKVGTNADGMPPKITLPKGKPAEPTKIISEPIIKGTGEMVQAKDTIVAHYAVELWNGKPGGGNTWQQGGPQEVPLAQMPGWEKALAGEKVGSRVLVVVPKSELDAKQRKEIGTAVVFVIDILDVM
ncbi:hypothetical protein AQ490_14215 [Wenjunlia vitaminophila]|uniref:Peptidyl-prolyl cis-trans isomerase n=1 Tax=Wenjunlia vitaminophila TaxID=76728 RepID=A0A0T6LW69_WENVI|nr:FKBP-type peptidyl-prolyl cis-trans isomerase [Wenjunlia vitaminophila]KRV50265.1 hypothetical protein AQ490_14215 [Wenjunlia vitaminophila]